MSTYLLLYFPISLPTDYLSYLDKIKMYSHINSVMPTSPDLGHMVGTIGTNLGIRKVDSLSDRYLPALRDTY